MRNSYSRFKCALRSFWDQFDLLIYLLIASAIGLIIGWGVTLRLVQAERDAMQTERTALSTERATLYKRFGDVRGEMTAQCTASLDALRTEQKGRADDWKTTIGGLTTQIQNANRNADNCHAQVAALVPKINKAASDSKVAADKSTEAAAAANSEHAQQTLIRKYSK